MGTTAEKLTYLNTTKAQIKDGINRLGGELTNLDTFREYKEALDDIYDKLPKVTGTGSDLSLTPTLKGGLNILPLGNAEQDGTPTPDNPIDVKVVTGENQVVVCNKNIFDGEIEIGSIQNGNNIVTTSNYRSKNYTLINSSTTYTFSINSIANQVAIFCYDKDYQWINSYGSEYGYLSNNGIFTTPENAKYLRFRSYGADFDLFATGNIQLEIGSTATTYVAHQEQSYTLHLGSLELCKIGDYQDVITGTKDNWKIVRKVGKVVLDGVYTSNITQLKDSAMKISNIINGYDSNTTVIHSIYCNYLKSIKQDNVYLQNVGIAMLGGNTNAMYCCISSEINTRDKFINWLITHNLVVYYLLATPTEETITNTTLIEELNGLQELLSYDGTTNFTITSDTLNAQMLVQVSALKGE